jgi:phosphatidylglycerol:prolipoprotein diacylglycerol transferase
MNGCCFGSCTSSPIGVHFPKGSPPWLEQYHANLIDGSAALSCSVHPVQLYESACNFLIYVLLVVLFRRTKRVGLISAVYLMLYSVVRFSVEFFRGDRGERVAVGSLSIGQFVSIPLFILGLSLLVMILVRKNRADNNE